MAVDTRTRPVTRGSLSEVMLDRIQPSALNPRKHFDEDYLAGLAESIRQHGLLEPIVVRTLAPLSTGGKTLYEIVAGEQRWKACGVVGLRSIPIVDLGVISDEEALELSLVENLQRRNLNAIEEAEGYRLLREKVGLKQAEIAERVKVSQPVIANRLRLLELPDAVREQIRAGELSASHGVALARYKEYPRIIKALATGAVDHGWSSAVLEKDPDWPMLHALTEANAVAVLDYRARFDTSVCKTCPFNAKRNNWGNQQVCLRPSHFDQLNADVEAEKARASVAAIAAAESLGDTLVRVRDLPYESYETVFDHRKPAGCSAECPCRRAAVGYDGAVTTICVAPKRFKAFVHKEAVAAGKDRRAQEQRVLASGVEAVDAIAAPTSRELALLIEPLIDQTNTKAVVEPTFKRHGIVFDAGSTSGSWRERQNARITRLAAIDVTILTRIAVELRLRAEAYAIANEDDHWGHWYIGEQPTSPNGKAHGPIIGREGEEE